ncbi:MAG: ABC transporter substrate-binding protein [Flavobacteriales bacterium]|nr:ABC transporter substrate-binding protein [Flavobacteriales bacterium]
MKIPKKTVEEAAAQAAKLVPLRIAGVPEHFNLPFMLGLERRAFVRAGVDLKWRTVPEGTGAMCELLRAGELDLAILVTEGVVRDIVNGAPVRIVSPYVDTPVTWGVHVASATSIQRVEDIKGLPFLISRPNSGSHLAAMAYARDQGWGDQELQFEVVNDLKGARERLENGPPAVFLWERSTTKPLVDAWVLRCFDEYRAQWPAFVIAARIAVLEEHGPQIGRLLKVVRDQASGLMSKRSAPEMIAQRYAMPVEDAKTWFTATRWNVDGRMDPLVIASVTEALHRCGLLDAAFDAGTCSTRLLHAW